jgi:hypothetical protein
VSVAALRLSDLIARSAAIAQFWPQTSAFFSLSRTLVWKRFFVSVFFWYYFYFFGCYFVER